MLTEPKSTVFRCTACRETISVSASTCRFCGVVLNRDDALAAAADEASANAAYADALNARSTVNAAFGIYVAGLILFVWMCSAQRLHEERIDYGFRWHLLHLLAAISALVMLPALLITLRLLIRWDRRHEHLKLDHPILAEAREIVISGYQHWGLLSLAYTGLSLVPAGLWVYWYFL